MPTATHQNPTDAVAVHSYGAIGGMLPMQDCTSISLGKPYLQGGVFIATYPGHLPHGQVLEINGKLYRLNVALAERVAA